MLAALLPVRNGEEDLPGYLESVARFADAVVALDDGSSDRTRDILEAHPLVKIVLANPPRDGFAGWEEATDRNRLLEAAAELEPEWILSLDVDERIDPDEAAALRSFIQADARPGFAYRFLLFRMIGDLHHYGPPGLWVCRLFSFEPGQRFPTDRRLHFIPVATSIPRSRWVRTTFRIKHLASLTEERRRARFQKYLEADPDRAYQADYSNLLTLPGLLKEWRPRPNGAPFLMSHGRRMR